jgi:hypothetical protein
MIAKPKNTTCIAVMAKAILKQSKPIAPRESTARATPKPVMHKSKKPAATRPVGSKRAATEPQTHEIAEREAVARALFNPASARAARAAFLKR